MDITNNTSNTYYVGNNPTYRLDPSEVMVVEDSFYEGDDTFAASINSLYDQGFVTITDTDVIFPRDISPVPLKFQGWWEEDPADSYPTVHTGGGGIELGDVGVLRASYLQGLAEGENALFAHDGIQLGANDGSWFSGLNIGGQIAALPSSDPDTANGVAFAALAESGGTIALDCGGMTIVNLPTSDPHVATALYIDGTDIKISTG